MPFFTQLKSLCARWLRRSSQDQSLDDELRFHIEMLAQEQIRQGAAPEQAYRAARLKFGGPEQVKERVREARVGAWFDSFLQDIRFALRTLRKNPGFAAIAIVTLALGIGANATIFSIVDGILWQRLPYADVSRIVTISSHKRMNNSGMTLYSPLPPDDVPQLGQMTPAIQQIASYAAGPFILAGGDAPEFIGGGRVSGDFFATMGAKPILGRPILPSDVQPGHDGVVVLSYPLWRNRFGADPAIVGRTLALNGRNYTVIGVMPQHFDFALNDASGSGLWTPLVVPPGSEHDQAAGGSIVARLKRGVSYDVVNAQLKTVAPRFWPALPPVMNGCEFVASSIIPTLSVLKTPLLVLTGAVAFVLLIACVNISALLLGRGWSRQREIAVRSALGATRWRIVRQLLSEGLIIAGAGCAAAIAITVAAMRMLPAIAPVQLQPKLAQSHFDAHVLSYMLGLSVLACLLFALLPSVQISGIAVNDAIKGDVAGPFSAISRRPNKLRSALVIFEIAAAVVLVVGAALMGRSLLGLMQINLGFHPDHILTASVRLSPACNAMKKDDVERCELAASKLVETIAKDAGVEAVAASNSVPMNPASAAIAVSIEGKSGQFGFMNGNFIAFRGISAGYFRTLGTPLLVGRDFNATDTGTSESVAIVNRAFADQLLGGSNALGVRFGQTMPGATPKTWLRIIGVVANSEDGNHEDPHANGSEPGFYLPLAQTYVGAPVIIVRTAADPLAFLPSLRRLVASVDKSAPLTEVATMDQIVSQFIAQPRFETALFASFGVLGLALAIVGIYGVISYRVTQRTREIGIRVALGAQRVNILRLVLREALLLAFAGVFLGLAGSFALTRFLRSLLFAIKPTDPVTFAAVAIALMLVALLASYIPARRAMRVDPVSAMRCE